jgi:hypothetical protein
MSDRRARTAGAIALAALIGLLIWALWSRKQSPPLAPAPPMGAAHSAETPVRESSPMPVSARAPTAPLPPIIDTVTVEKDEVCEGEENLVTVQAHTADGNDAFLHYQVGPTRGSPVAVRSYLDERGRPTPHRVTVFGKNNVASSAEVPSFRVKRCGTDAMVVIDHRLRPNTLAEFDFEARIVGTGSMAHDAGAIAAFRPRMFRWSFGDGTHEESREAHAVHGFASRPQDTLYSHFLVTVEVLAENGRMLRGRHAIELLNPAFEAFAYKGVVVLFADLDPRFPVLSGSGVVDQGVRLWHTRPEVVTITKVSVTTRRLDGQRLPAVNTSPGSVLGGAVIAPGRGLDFHVVLDTRLEPDTLSRDHALEGRTQSGHPVRGAFSVMRPPALPSKEKHQPISDPTLVAKVKIAREVLHREYVTDEDLWALERAGHFDGLRVDARAPDPLSPSPTAPTAK